MLTLMAILGSAQAQMLDDEPVQSAPTIGAAPIRATPAIGAALATEAPSFPVAPMAAIGLLGVISLAAHKRRQTKTEDVGAMKKVSHLPVSQKSSVVLVSVTDALGPRLLLLGVGPDGAPRLLSELASTHEVDLMTGQAS